MNGTVRNFRVLPPIFMSNISWELHEEYGVVTHFEIGVPFKNDDEYAWPSVLSKV